MLSHSCGEMINDATLHTRDIARGCQAQLSLFLGFESAAAQFLQERHERNSEGRGAREAAALWNVRRNHRGKRRAFKCSTLLLLVALAEGENAALDQASPCALVFCIDLRGFPVPVRRLLRCCREELHLGRPDRALRTDDGSAQLETNWQ